MDIAETMGVWVGYKYACSCSFIHCFAIVSAVVSTLLNFVTMFRRAHEENVKQAELERKKAEKDAEKEKMKLSPLRIDAGEQLPSPLRRKLK